MGRRYIYLLRLFTARFLRHAMFFLGRITSTRIEPVVAAEERQVRDSGTVIGTAGRPSTIAVVFAHAQADNV